MFFAARTGQLPKGLGAETGRLVLEAINRFECYFANTMDDLAAYLDSVAHPAVTVATPATSSARHMVDNMGAAYGRLPDETMRKRMVAHIEAL